MTSSELSQTPRQCLMIIFNGCLNRLSASLVLLDTRDLQTPVC